MNVKYVKSSCCLTMLLACLIFPGCSLIRSSRKTVVPMHVILIDDSRSENQKIRHVFREFFIKYISEYGSNWMCLHDTDGLLQEITDTIPLDYDIHFDIMDYSTHDIIDGQNKLLVSVTITKHSNSIVLSSCIQSGISDDIEEVCNLVSCELAKSATKHLSKYKTYLPEPERNEETFDSSSITKEDVIDNGND